MKFIYNHEVINRLIDKVKRGDLQAREEFMRLHGEYLEALVEGFKGKISVRSIDGLLEAAKIGLIQAALDFDEGTGFTFIAYSVWYINKRILEEVHNLHSRFTEFLHLK